MENRPGIDFTKQEESTTGLVQATTQEIKLQRRHNYINIICRQLSTSTKTFNEENTYKAVVAYVLQYRRWLYADISGYLFSCDEQTISTFLSNLDKLQLFAHNQCDSCSSSDAGQAERIKTAVDKLWDHSNLAQKQNASLHDNDDTFGARFEKNLIPFEARFTRDMNMQFISLVAIFTALSFIVFGGITSLDNIFNGVTSLPVLELIIVGCIWSICITNLVFVFMFFVSKLTKISIKSTDKSDAGIGEKYPFVIWCNFVLLLILTNACWLYYIDYSNSGGWLLSFSNNNQVLSSLGGFIIIGFVFGRATKLLYPTFRPPKNPTPTEPDSAAHRE